MMRMYSAVPLISVPPTPGKPRYTRPRTAPGTAPRPVLFPRSRIGRAPTRAVNDAQAVMSWSRVFPRDHQHRAWSQPVHPLTGGAEDKIGEGPMPARTGDDEVCMAFDCHLGDRFGGLADRRLHVNFRVKSGSLEVVDLQAHLVLEDILVGMNRVGATASRHQFIDVSNHHVCSVFLRQRLCNRHEAVSRIGSV